MFRCVKYTTKEFLYKTHVDKLYRKQSTMVSKVTSITSLDSHVDLNDLLLQTEHEMLTIIASVKASIEKLSKFRIVKDVRNKTTGTG